MEAGNPRLNKSTILWKGLDVLAKDGPGSITAARISRELNVTTGSFYWHFNTVEDFRQKLKEFFLEEIVLGITNEAKARFEDPREILKAIGEMVKQRKTYRYDAAMRNWAKTSSEAEKIIVSADEFRREMMTELLRAAGENDQDAKDHVNLLGIAWLGSQDMKDPDYRFKLLGLITKNSN